MVSFRLQVSRSPELAHNCCELWFVELACEQQMFGDWNPTAFTLMLSLSLRILKTFCLFCLFV